MMRAEAAEERAVLKREAEAKTSILQRLARIEGQVRGLRQMVEGDRQTSEQIQQVNAVVAALREVALLSISQEIKAKLIDMAAAPSQAGDEMQALLELLRSTFRLS